MQENGELTFHIDDDEKQGDHGSSLYGDHAMVHKDNLAVTVESVDFAEFLLTNFVPEDLVLVRMDIEGAEYEVLPQRWRVVTVAAGAPPRDRHRRRRSHRPPGRRVAWQDVALAAQVHPSGYDSAMDS